MSKIVEKFTIDKTKPKFDQILGITEEQLVKLEELHTNFTVMLVEASKKDVNILSADLIEMMYRFLKGLSTEETTFILFKTISGFSLRMQKVKPQQKPPVQ